VRFFTEAANKTVETAAYSSSMLTKTSSGTRILMIRRMTRSSASMSISLLWMRISHLSHVCVPSPQGDFKTGTRRRLVGKGTGPVILTPVLSAMVLSSMQTSSNFLKSVLVSRILAFLAIAVLSPLCCLKSAFIVLNTLRHKLFGKKISLNVKNVEGNACLVQPKLQVRALLIDLDGTIVDSSEAHREAGRAGFAAIGFQEFNDERIAREVARRLEQDLPIDDLFAEFQIDIDVEERFLPAYLTAYYSAVITKSKPFPKVKETLQVLAKDFKLALITLRYADREQVIDELTHLGIKKHFLVVVTALDINRPKPSPDALLLAASKLNVSIEQCAIVGDSTIDVQAGKAAGAKTVAVLTGLFSQKELEQQKPDLLIKDINALSHFLAKPAS